MTPIPTPPATAPVVFVTGVSSGIGRATALRFAEQGFRVYGSVRQLEGAAPLRGVRLVQMDVRDTDAVQAAVATVIAEAGRIDVLVNNAGVSMVGAAEETSIDEAQAMLDTHVLGSLRTAQAVLPHMRRQRSGRIVNVSSVLGFLPAPFMGLYAAAKHAVEGMSETMDHELRPFGVRVCLVEPAFTKTSLEANAPRARQPIAAYDDARRQVAAAVARSMAQAPAPATVADAILRAARGPWRMRTTPGGQASLLRMLRRFMPAGLVDASLRTSFGLR